MELEVNNDGVYCSRCGAKYSRRKGFFPVSYAVLYKGIGYLTVCRDCVDTIYNAYFEVCRDQQAAVRQTCRKLDIYWSKTVYEQVTRKSTPRSIMTQYLSKMASVVHSGKCYDDTLKEENSMWSFPGMETPGMYAPATQTENGEDADEDDGRIPDEVIAFWGSGYTPNMYAELERRKKYYLSRLKNQGELDVGTEILIRQICNLEVNIARDSAVGKSIEKSVNTLNNLLGSMNMKPAQRRDDELEAEMSSTPMGVWIYRFENKRPLPEVDEDLKDVNHLKKYIFTWMGHLCKMLGIQNGYTKMYEAEIDRLRVERPEYDGDDDEALLSQAYSEDGGTEEA